MAAINSSNFSIIAFSILLILFAILLPSASSRRPYNKHLLSIYSHRGSLARRRYTQRQVPNCSEMASRSQCLEKPHCRWCKSEALDDMCFSKYEAWRLPQEVFVCD